MEQPAGWGWNRKGHQTAPSSEVTSPHSLFKHVNSMQLKAGVRLSPGRLLFHGSIQAALSATFTSTYRVVRRRAVCFGGRGCHRGLPFLSIFCPARAEGIVQTALPSYPSSALVMQPLTQGAEQQLCQTNGLPSPGKARGTSATLHFTAFM